MAESKLGNARNFKARKFSGLTNSGLKGYGLTGPGSLTNPKMGLALKTGRGKVSRQ